MKTHLDGYVRVATSEDYKYAAEIANEVAFSAQKRGTGINRRPADYFIDKMKKGIAVIATNPETGEWLGFCCIEVWDHEKYIANSGLIVSPSYRGLGVAREIKLKLFELGRKKFPFAKIFSLTANQTVIRVNKELGYVKVPFEKVLRDKLFNEGNQSWVDYVELMTHKAHLNYVAMVFDPMDIVEIKSVGTDKQCKLVKVG